MFSRKKPEPQKRRNHDLSQFGLTEIPDDFDPTGGAMDDDSDLEAELSAIVGGGGKKKPQVKPKSTLMPTSDLDKMIADSMRDIGSDEELSGDEDDPELLGELQGISGIELESEPTGAVEEKESTEEQQLFLPTTTTDTISIIKNRIEMYTLAEKGAKSSGESAKARRYNRGLKTLNDLLKQSMAGKTINVDDIPPEVSVKGAKPAEEPSPDAVESPKTPSRTAPAVPIRPAPLPPAVQTAASVEEKTEEPKSDNPILVTLNERKQEYKIAALTAKRSGDTAMALQFVKVLKQFDMVIKLCEEGQNVDLSDMPPPPNEFADFLAKMQAGSNEPAKAEEPAPPPAPIPEETTETPTNMLEALEQRLLKYKSVEEAAKAENNSSKARRFGRIVKQYEDAIKSYKAGRPVAFDELPTPPGFGPLPGTNDEQKPAAPEAVPSPKPAPPPKPATAPIAELDEDTSAESTPKPAHRSPKQELTTRLSGNQHSTNLAEQQMKILLDRQKEFKVAAIEAKKAGEIEQAKEYLKIYKGFEGLLNAASSGLPVDLSTLPVPPSQRDNLEASFAIVSEGDCDPNDDISDISVRLEEQLAKQLMMCKNTRDHHKAMGDIAGMNRFENLALTVQKDLDLIRYSKRKNFPFPKFHYEQKSFNIVHCNTDLTDNEVEIMIIRGINYNVPNSKDVDSYVKVEFPYPQEDFFKAKSSLVRDTDSPDYNQRFKVDIQRSNRQCQRLFKRQAVKFEVYSRGGFLRSDILIGTVNLKLQPLETKCEIHDTYDLMDGRKPVGGKLEIKVRVRNPILTKQIEHVNEKWLVLDT